MYLNHSNPFPTESQTSYCISLPTSCPSFRIFIYLPTYLSIYYLFICLFQLFSAAHMYMVMGSPMES